ncbi:hypothetical protein R3P38DRAFT_3215592 [Favolaschia claudopus]|uniref:Uncharacterized protein n=1 Tax=Favolaschia claudopus TaxID=2862362 RepID=A0AAW0A8W4_9AGAR
MSDSALGCAQNLDGSLRDASDIPWYNDVDDSALLSGPPPPRRPMHRAPFIPSSPTSDLSTKSQESGGRLRAVQVALLDLCNVDKTVPSSDKRKASPPPQNPRKKTRLQCPVQSSDKDSDAESAGYTTDPVVGTEGETPDTSTVNLAEYEKFKAMGNVDHEQVCTFSLSESTQSS